MDYFMGLLNTPASLAAVIAALFAFLSVVITQVGNIRHGQAITQIHIDMNSRLDQLVAAASKAARAEGLAEGIVAGKASVLPDLVAKLVPGTPPESK